VNACLAEADKKDDRLIEPVGEFRPHLDGAVRVGTL
jgi:hypothetical protein